MNSRAVFPVAVSVSREPTHQPTPSGSMPFSRVHHARHVFFLERSQMIAVRKLPARYAPIVMPFVLSILMTAVVSVISTLRSLGATPAFLATWPSAWALSWLVAFPTLLMVLPLVRRIVTLLVAAPP